MKKIILVALLVCVVYGSYACLILFITNGNDIMVANHEDWYAQDAEVSILPATAGKFGMVYFDFASEGTAQGGMNSKGLFFDGTRTPFAPYNENESREDCHCYIWKKILAECADVEQAIKYVQKFSIPEMENIHVLFADRKGHSAIVGVYNGNLQIHRRTGNHQLLTNFNISNPAYGGEPVCQRFTAADSMLAIDSSVSVGNLEKILSNTTQGELTVYSNIYNLSLGEVYVYTNQDYRHRVKINLANELKKGKHVVSIARLFKSYTVELSH